MKNPMKRQLRLNLDVVAVLGAHVPSSSETFRSLLLCPALSELALQG